MTKPDVMFKVTGRYMDGTNLVAYHLVDSEGRQYRESKDRVIYLIGKGLLINMRLQVGDNKELIPRGKGINLNTLPVYDINKQGFRYNTTSQEAANSKVKADKNSVANQMGQYTITRRIMMKNQCIGYEIKDYTGKTYNKQRDKVVELAVQRLISNAVANKKINDKTGETELVLRGVGTQLRDLPYLIVDNMGNIIDPKINSKSTVRAAYMKSNGILKDEIKNQVYPFRAGDFLICLASGDIVIKNRLEVEQAYKIDKSVNVAICDGYVKDARYNIEIFGNTAKVGLDNAIVRTWAILRAIDNK